MASLLHLPFIFLISFSLIAPATSNKCSPPPVPISGNAQFTDCTDLPYLRSSLHWSYISSNSTLSIAFLAPLASPTGWISWGINPTATGMIGTQALIAFKAPNGSMVVDTYELASYKSITRSDKLSFKVLNSKAEYSNGVMQILATLALPSNMTTINQVWQTGPSVKDGTTPTAHVFNSDHLKSKGTLNLAGDGKNGPASAPTGDGKNAPTPAPAGDENKKSGSSRIWSNDAIFYVSFAFIGVLFFN